MRFGVLALDYDGTIALDGVLHPDVRSAIDEVRGRGIAVVIATGRTLSDLKALVGSFAFLDAIVAENGAVIAFPNDQFRLLAAPPPTAFLQELSRRAIPFTTGQCVVEVEAAWAQQVLAVIRELELPLVLLFNRGRLMVLPQAVSKATGLRAALSALRLSAHNAIAIGDAENDHDLLAACELGVAVSWGSAALKRCAEEVLQGEGPGAVAAYIRRAAEQVRLPPDRLGRRHLTLGTLEDGRPLALAIRGRNLLIAGDPQSGKSWVTGLLCEQLILQGYCVWVIDPEGEFGGLESLPGVVILGGGRRPPHLNDLVRALRYPDVSVVVDLAHVAHQEKFEFLYSLLPMLASLRRSSGLPHRIVLDEAHYFLHEPDVSQLLDLQLAAYVLVTYRPADLHCDVRRAIEGTIVTRITDEYEEQALLSLCGAGRPEWRSVLPNLALGEAALLPGIEEAGGKLQKFNVLPRLTPHIRHKTKYLDVPLIERRGFVFTRNGKAVAPPARTLKEFVALLAHLPPQVLDGHARRGDFSRWAQEVLHDRLLASDLQTVERQYQLGQISRLSKALAEPIQERYEPLPPALSVSPPASAEAPVPLELASPRAVKA
ncbi:MAG: HAD hydrolase family protein [Terriglobales bacterium]